jgi:hypothetical protein
MVEVPTVIIQEQRIPSVRARCSMINDIQHLLYYIMNREIPTAALQL